jgi:hypothetical protein
MDELDTIFVKNGFRVIYITQYMLNINHYMLPHMNQSCPQGQLSNPARFIG